jgi:hypothetical protein
MCIFSSSYHFVPCHSQQDQAPPFPLVFQEKQNVQSFSFPDVIMALPIISQSIYQTVGTPLPFFLP